MSVQPESFAAVFASLSAALESLPSGPEVLSLDDLELIDALRFAGAAVNRLEGLSTWAAGALDQRVANGSLGDSLGRNLGAANTAALLRDLTGIPFRRARDLVGLGRQVVPPANSTPEPPTLEGASPEGTVGDALARGDLGAGVAKLIADTVSRAERARGTDADQLETELVNLATGAKGQAMHEDEVRKVCSTVRQELERTDPIKRDRDRTARRALYVGQEKDGLVSLRGMLLPEVAATLEATINALTSPRNSRNALVSDSLDAGDTSHGRTPEQKRHDAFASIINVAASSKDLPTAGGAPVTVMIQVKQEELEQRRSGRVHTNSGPTPLSGPAIEHAACSGAIQYFAQDPRGRIVDLGSLQRVFTANQRRAILARDGGCVIPGCDVPAAWCEIHHVKPHARGGQTHTDNGVMLCYYHHRHIEHNGWQVRMRDGTPQVRAPKWKDPTGAWHWAHPLQDTG